MSQCRKRAWNWHPIPMEAEFELTWDFHFFAKFSERSFLIYFLILFLNFQLPEIGGIFIMKKLISFVTLVSYWRCYRVILHNSQSVQIFFAKSSNYNKTLNFNFLPYNRISSNNKFLKIIIIGHLTIPVSVVQPPLDPYCS